MSMITYFVTTVGVRRVKLILIVTSHMDCIGVVMGSDGTRLVIVLYSHRLLAYKYCRRISTRFYSAHYCNRVRTTCSRKFWNQK